MGAWMFRSIERIAFGVGTVRMLGELLAGLHVDSAVLVSDKNLSAHTEAAVDSLRSHGIGYKLFDGGRPEPTTEMVNTLCASLAGEQFDAFIGLGGGSNIDLAKAGAVVHTLGGVAEDYVGSQSIPGPVLPIVAIPTTGGSGSEMSAASILSVPDRYSKVAIVDNRIRPRLAVIDPELHLTCPPAVTRDSGVDALCHAIEALTSADSVGPRGSSTYQPVYQGRHALTDALAEQSVRLIAANLPAALADPEDLEARTGMAVGALLAGMAMSNTGVHLVHALAYPVGAMTGTSHGASVSALLPAVLDFITPYRRTEVERVVEIVRSTGRGEIDSVRGFLASVGAPGTLRELGFKPGDRERAAGLAFEIKRLLMCAPVSVSREDITWVLDRAQG